MPTPHFNYYPPSGAVLDQNEPKAYWNGRAWMKNKKTYAVPSGHHLVGRAGGPLNGWYYDWSKRAWMEPGPTQGPAPAPVVQRPAPPPAPQPLAPRPQPPAPQPQPKKENSMKCDHTRKSSRSADIMEVLKVVSYVAGPIVVAIGQSLKAPDRPPVTATQPQWLVEENQNRYTENNAAWESRKGLWTNVGQSLLTFGSSGLSKGDKEEIGNIVHNAMKKAA